MDSPSEQPSQTSQTSTSSKNVKNLSIKEFFTTRLMRTRSLETGANSPKDETTNWFEEFRARMSKRSQTRHTGGVTDDIAEESGTDSNNEGTSQPSATNSKPKTSSGDEYETSKRKDNCDSGSGEGFRSLPSGIPCETTTIIDDSQSSSQRARNPKFKISSADSPNLDTASIHTLYDRRDSRFEKLPKRHRWALLSRLGHFTRCVLLYMIPLDYNLPWKLISIVNVTFVIIVIGLASESSPNSMSFSFINGFLSGLFAGAACLVVVLLSIFVNILPKTNGQQETSFRNQTTTSPRLFECTASDNVTMSDIVKHRRAASDFSTYEILDSEDRDLNCDREAAAIDEILLIDDDYKGWMIEFIGDYELRNRSDFKLKLVFVKLEDRVLHLCKPKNSHDTESTTTPVFVQQRLYDLNNVKKFTATLLIPKSVRNRQKYVWSKKYPIKVEFQEEEDPAKSIESIKIISLTLFARSCREKEEWFRRFKRIVESNRIAQGLRSNKRTSLHSDTMSSPEHDTVSLENLRPNTPSSNYGSCVQTSQSSHLLGDSKRILSNLKPRDDTEDMPRTKSCEYINTEQVSGAGGSADNSSQEDYNEPFQVPVIGAAADDSTLTRETAYLFSQAIEYSDFIDAQPQLNYQEYIERLIRSSKSATSTSDWFNALTGRIFFDVFSHSCWSIWFKRKIQRKLYRIRLPYFMETLTLTKIDLGSEAPQFLNVVSHNFDSFGLSIDFDMTYSGGLTMTFETKLNLLKIKSDATSANPPPNSTPATASSSGSSQNLTSQPADITTTKDNNSTSETHSDILNRESTKHNSSSSNSTRTSDESSDSDEAESNSSSDSSFEEGDANEISDWEDYGAEKTRQNIVKFVDRIASSRYFQQATENRYIKKKLQDISNCPLVLIVQIQSLSGILTVNVPPPQTDRIWYGFKPMPELNLKALPKMGDRELNLSHVTDWIERKLAEEFRKILVIPNMEDIVLPVLKSDHLKYVTTTK